MLVFYIALIAPTSTPVCMNEHEPFALCLSVITLWSANNTRPQSTTPHLNVYFLNGANSRSSLSPVTVFLMSNLKQQP